MSVVGADSSVKKVEVSAYTIPTDAPEGDGTLQWDSTTLVVCEIQAADYIGLGYTYGNKATASVADDLASKCLVGQSALEIPRLHESMLQQVRNDGSRGIASMAISALDIALWDLKAKVLGCSLIDLIGAANADVAAYGSGGFTTYNNLQLQKQLGAWAEQGFKSVKMKIGAEPAGRSGKSARRTRSNRAESEPVRGRKRGLRFAAGNCVCEEI